MHGGFRVQPAGDAALVLEWPARFDEAISMTVIAAAEAIRQRHGTVIRDTVVGYHTLTVYFDPLAVDAHWLEQQVSEAASDPAARAHVSAALVDVPVCYGGACGADLSEIAATLAVPEQEVIDLHTSRTYRVFVIGFVPGFAYMGPTDARLALPRRVSPRTRVPAGSVAIAAGQTGIYPMETPGGWHLLGRTPVRPFDPSRPQPVLFRPGDRVRFYAITPDEYERSATW